MFFLYCSRAQFTGRNSSVSCRGGLQFGVFCVLFLELEICFLMLLSHTQRCVGAVFPTRSLDTSAIKQTKVIGKPPGQVTRCAATIEFRRDGTVVTSFDGRESVSDFNFRAHAWPRACTIEVQRAVLVVRSLYQKRGARVNVYLEGLARCARGRGRWLSRCVVRVVILLLARLRRASWHPAGDPRRYPLGR